MEETLATPTPSMKRADLEAAVDRMIAEIDQARERMREIQERTERLGAETRAMIEQLKAL